MQEFIVSARKYRPMTFDTVVGQSALTTTLKNAIATDKLAHAYLFCGPRGVGKTTTARIFAKAINCSNPSPQMDPCGKCESCLSFSEGRSYCIHELDAASNNGVDDIRNLMEQVQIPPQVGKYSVYIIDEVHMLSPAAFNAFLKTLEEPPAHAIFILATTEKHKILPTILSRCQTYDFNRISVPDIVSNLRSIAGKEGVSIDDESLHVIAQKADGAMRDALTIFDQTVAFCGTDVHYADVLRNLNVLDYEFCFSLVNSFLAGDYGKALLTFDDILSKGFNALHFCASLSAHFRNLMVARNGGLDALLELPDSIKSRYSEQASVCSLRFLYDALSATTACEAGYRLAVNPRLHIEFMLMKLSFLCKAPSATVVAAAPAPAAPVAAAPVAAAPVAVAPAPDAASSSVAVAAPAAAPASATPAPAAPAATAPATETPAPVTADSPSAATPADPSPSGSPSIQAQEAASTPAKPRARKTAVRSSLSLASMTSSGETKETAGPSVQSDILPEDDAIKAAWSKIPDDYASSPRLASALRNALLTCETSSGCKEVTFKVSNESQQKWIKENKLHALEGRLQELAGSSKIRLSVGVVPMEDTTLQPYTDNEKAAALMEKNEGVKSLIKTFELETR